MTETINLDRPAAAPTSLEEFDRRIDSELVAVLGAQRLVHGEGPIGAAIAFVGEQPGDVEDLERRPFVGPAGQMLDRALADVGIDRKSCYVTNAVKHFKFIERGARRIHQKPTSGEIKHYKWWLEHELDLVSPRLIVALGATAVQALAGKPVSILRFRGETRFDGRRGYITVHPSYILRLRHEMERKIAFDAFVSDLKVVRRLARV